MRTNKQMKLLHGNCLEVMATLDAESVDSIVTDPPYGLSFMGKDWDHSVPGEAFWREALRVAKPGAHLLAFGGSRTYHRLACAIEDAGWEIRDCIMWVYGSGFPKSHDVSKAIDREAGATTAWQGWGTALKPAYEPIIVARKPLIGTVAANVQQYGTGAINVDGCRVETTDNRDRLGSGAKGSNGCYGDSVTYNSYSHTSGRWPANFIHDGSDEVMELFPVTTSGNLQSKHVSRTTSSIYSGGWAKSDNTGRSWGNDSGSAARFFYCAKASKRDRDEGLDMFDVVRTGGMQATADGSMLTGSGNERTTARANHHPTVKPTDLMRYLCRLVTPSGGTVLDSFMGSGSTGKGATLEGFDFIGIEQNAEYLEIAKARIQHAIDSASEKLFSDFV
jgi:site-specific DNA-methyltransferase (adenine-specific)